jgi:hypothetical protein
MSRPDAGVAFRLPAAVCCVLLAGTLLTGCTSRRAPGPPGADPPREGDRRGLAQIGRAHV